LFRFLKGGNIDRRLVVEEFRATRLARQVIKEAAANQAATGTGALKQA
jgi:hypothetical protein